MPQALFYDRDIFAEEGPEQSAVGKGIDFCPEADIIDIERK